MTSSGRNRRSDTREPLRSRSFPGSNATECNEFYNRLHGTSPERMINGAGSLWRALPAIFAVVRDAGSIVATQALIPLTSSLITGRS